MTEPTANLNRQFLTTLGNLGIVSHRLDLIRDAARLHRQQLIGASELYAVIEADASAGVAPATDRAGLRELIAKALSDARRPGLGGMTEADAVAYMADAVLSVLPASAGQADRAAVLEAAADVAASQNGCPCNTGHTIAHLLRRMAAVPAGSAGTGHSGGETAGCGCPSEDAPEHMFGGKDCDCIPFTRQEKPPRYLNRPTDTVDMISGWETGQNCPHHRNAAGQSAGGAPQPKEA